MEEGNELEIRNKFESEIERRLLQGSSGSHQIFGDLTIGSDNAERGALNFLRGNGYIANVSNSVFVLTPAGWSFIDRRQHPRRVWFRQNWFPLLIAASTVTAQLIAAGLSAWLIS